METATTCSCVATRTQAASEKVTHLWTVGYKIPHIFVARRTSLSAFKFSYEKNSNERKLVTSCDDAMDFVAA